MFTIWLLCAASLPESYREYVQRGIGSPPADLEPALVEAGTPALRPEEAAPLISANDAFLDDAAWDGNNSDLVRPSTDARVAVPLLVQVVRDWSSYGAAQRGQAYAPIVDALRDALLVGTPQRTRRILVPGSGTGRLAHDIAAALGARMELVAVEPDVHAQLLARWMLERAEGDRGEGSEGGGKYDGEECASSGQPPIALYPSLHLSTGWANATDRLAPIRVPDVEPSVAVREASIELVVGRFPDDAGDEAASGEAGPSSPWRAFDAAATCFFLDVASDLLGVIATLRRMLAASRGVWANLGPLAYPDAPFEAMGGHAPAYALTASQLLGLVRRGGFELEQQRMVPCEYGGLPRQLERTERMCLFFVARPV